MAFSSFLSFPKLTLLLRRTSPIPSIFFSSSTSPTTPYPLQYELIASYPAVSPPSTNHRRKSQPLNTSFDSQSPVSDESSEASGEMDKSKRKYYLKRRKRMFGSDDDDRPPEDKYVELKPEVVELPTLHAREEELYFYDALSYPWEKEKHYRMVYQLEKKYFPDQCLDKAFVEEDPAKGKKSRGSEEGKTKNKKGEKNDDELVDQKMVFFEEESVLRETGPPKKVDVSGKKVEELFKCLKKVPSAGEVSAPEPFISTRKTGLPPRWDGPNGTVVLVNKPKGQIFKLYI